MMSRLSQNAAACVGLTLTSTGGCTPGAVKVATEGMLVGMLCVVVGWPGADISGGGPAPSAACSYDDGEPGCAASLDGQHLRAAIVVQICGATFDVRLDTSWKLQARHVDLGGRTDGRIGVVLQVE